MDRSVKFDKQDKKKPDFSIKDCSRLTVRSYEMYDYEKEIKRIKYPTYSISNAQDL